MVKPYFSYRKVVDFSYRFSSLVSLDYCAEISYSFDCDPLEQRRLDFSSDGKEPIVSVLGGTNEKTEKTRLKIYLKRESVLAFSSDSAHEVAIYSLK